MAYSIAIHSGHNSNVCFFTSNQIIEVIAEEKFSNIKDDNSFPKQSIEYLKKKYSIDILENVIFCSKRFWIHKHNKELFTGPPTTRIFFKSLENIINFAKIRLGYNSYLNKRSLLNGINFFKNNFHIKVKKFSSMDHHKCHAFSAYGFLCNLNNKYLSIVIDGQGDGKSTSISLIDGNSYELLSFSNWYNSLGELYSATTKALGFKKLQHEYKIMGLAAYSEEKYFSKIYKNIFKKLMYLDQNTGVPKSKISSRDFEKYLLSKFKGFRFDSIAGALQKTVEDLVMNTFEYWKNKYPDLKIIYSGGVVMNVKINKLLSEKFGDDIIFMPSGGDESLSIGAASYFISQNHTSIKLPKLTYYGPSFETSKIMDALSKTNNYSFDIICEGKKNSIDEAANLISKGEILCRYSGATEWGARSLGNRAILADPSNFDSFNKVNNYIKMRDFWMPFAPTILFEYKDKYLYFYGEQNNQYMVNAFDSTEEGQQKLKAAIHSKDKTVRAQILKQDDNPGYYNLIKQFYEISGIPALLNTSLNVHGYPLVSSPEQLLFTLENSQLDYCLINDEILIKKVLINRK